MATSVTSTAFTTGYAPVNGLEMYYEIHGKGGTPLLLLHGALFNSDLQFGKLIPSLAETRQVIAVDFQGHGRTNDIDRPLTVANLASDIAGLLAHLNVSQVDILGFSLGGGVTIELGVRYPELIRKLVVSSMSFQPESIRQETRDSMHTMTVEMIAGTPMVQEYLAKSPNPGKLQDLLHKIDAFAADFPGWTDTEIKAIPAPILIMVGDCDMVPLDLAIRFLQLRGGDVNGDFVGVPASQLAVLPGTTHYYALARPSLVLEQVVPILDAPLPGVTTSGA
jgi:pimeloyl-ACP methyl ester carboxylesterase